MAEVKKRFGKMHCETCGEPVTVKANGRGTLSYACQECDAAPYAKVGTIQHGIWLKKITGREQEAAPVEQAPEAAKPEAKQAKSSGTLLG